MRNRLKLHEIVNYSNGGVSCLIEDIVRYKKSLLILYGNDAILMVTDVMNAVQYGQIVPAREFTDHLNDYTANLIELTDQDRENQQYLINFQSIFLSKL